MLSSSVFRFSSPGVNKPPLFHSFLSFLFSSLSLSIISSSHAFTNKIFCYLLLLDRSLFLFLFLQLIAWSLSRTLLLFQLYSAECALASHTIPLHSILSCASSRQFVTIIILKSLSTSSLHLLRGLPGFRLPSILALFMEFGVFTGSMRTTCHIHLILSDFMHLTLSSPSRSSFISLLFLLLYVSPSFIPPYIRLTIFILNT